MIISLLRIPGAILILASILGKYERRHCEIDTKTCSTAHCHQRLNYFQNLQLELASLEQDDRSSQKLRKVREQASGSLPFDMKIDILY